MTSKREKLERYSGEESFTIAYPETGVWLIYIHNFLDEKNATELFNTLYKEVKWIDESSFYGHPPTRMKKWYGSFDYTYSGKLQQKDMNMPECLPSLMSKIQSRTRLEQKNSVNGADEKEVEYKTALLNLYKDGNQSISWHSDSEKGLQNGAPIASLSLGAIRTFKLRAIRTKEHLAMDKMPATKHIKLLPGSLFIMGGNCQQHWQHAVERESDVDAPRINLTFRHHIEV